MIKKRVFTFAPLDLALDEPEERVLVQFNVVLDLAEAAAFLFLAQAGNPTLIIIFCHSDVPTSRSQKHRIIPSESESHSLSHLMIFVATFMVSDSHFGQGAGNGWHPGSNGRSHSHFNDFSQPLRPSGCHY